MIEFYLNFQQANINEEARKASKDKFDKTVASQFSQSAKERAFLSLVAESEVKMFEHDSDTNNWEQVVNNTANNRKPCN